MTMQMPEVNRCEVQECSYNRNGECHALAITIGDTNTNALCDTFLRAGQKGGDMDATGKVGACKADACKHNHDLECSAPGITVGSESGKAKCKTFSMR